WAHLARLRAGLVEALQFVVREPDPEPAVENADRCGYRSGRAATALRLAADLGPFAGGKAVRDQRRLQRDDGSAALEGLAHLRPDDEEIAHQGIAPILPTQRAAAS